MNPKLVAIVSGGFSSEKEISLRSAQQIKKMIEGDHYQPYIVLITPKEWSVVLGENEFVPIDKNDFSFEKDGKKIHFDVALITIHGHPGENGIIQSYFELVGIPYSTGNVLSAALSANKFASKTYLRNFNVLTANAVLVRKEQEYNPAKIIRVVKLPCFVKPNDGGSSYGVTKVKEAKDLVPAIDKAFEESNEVIVEEFIAGTEITCGVIKTRDTEILLPITEIVSKTEYFDTQAKYDPSLADEITPARIPEAIAKECQELSSQIYDAMNFRGLVRVDFILKDKKLYFLEVNTTPGMSAESIVPKQLACHGMSLFEMYDLILQDALNP